MRARKLAVTISATLSLSLVCVPGIAHALDCASRIDAKSGSVLETIVELYTSEGCDSCPPADKWFSSLDYRRDGVVPLAFHVDYWDYIGWKDRFAKAAFSERQRETVRRQGGRTSYTPQVMLNGQDQRISGFLSGFSANVKNIAARPPRATMTMDYTAASAELDVALTATLPQSADRADAAVFLAITENNLSNRVTAGENRGVTLKHDHVVRAFFGPLSGEAKDRAEGKLVIQRPIVLERDWKRGDLSLVAFVQNLRSGDVYQALSAPLCPGT